MKLELSSLSPGKSEEQTLKIKKSKGKGFAKGGLHFGYEYRPAVNFDEKKRKDALGFGDKFRGFSILTGPKKHKRVFAQPPDPQRAEVPAPLQVISLSRHLLTFLFPLVSPYGSGTAGLPYNRGYLPHLCTSERSGGIKGTV